MRVQLNLRHVLSLSTECCITLAQHCMLALQALKHKALRLPDSKQPCLQQFQASEVCDLPPRLRALFEDNKVSSTAR